MSDKGDRTDSSASGSGSERFVSTVLIIFFHKIVDWFNYFHSDSGSSSGSGSASGGRSASEKSSNGDHSHHSDDTKSSLKHSNQNSSKSDHHTDKDSSSEDIVKRKSRSNHGKVKSDLWEDNPDIYGIRRSGRSRKEPDRLNVAVDSDSSEKGRSHNRKSRKKRWCSFPFQCDF